MKRTAVIGLALASMATVATGALAKPHGGGHGRGNLLMHIERGVQRLEITAEAKQAVYAVLDVARSERRALTDQIHTAREQMKASLDAETPSLDAVLAQADSIGALETQAKKIELAAVVKVKGLLTDEQWKQLREARGRRFLHGRCGGDEPTPA